MKRPTMLLNRVLLNEALQVSVAVERDAREIERRFEHEGMSFLTITLPSLCDTLDQGLAQGRITPSMFNGFKPFKRGGKLPALFAGFFMRVFDHDGALLEYPCIDSIRAIRQVTRLFKKVELPCSAARVSRAFERYITNDACCTWESLDPVNIRRIAGFLWTGLESLADSLYCSPGVFGTGATAERYGFNERHTVKQWPLRSEVLFPASYHTSHDEGDIDAFASIDFLESDAELPVRVVQVPKTLTTPRIISVEPSYMMLMQQSVAKPLMDWLESSQFPHQSIRFTHQTVNKEMARLGSIDGSNATIDLKDASDLVSLNLVKAIFSVAPTFLELIQACRSERARMPDGSVVKLQKFASMGSALCFPIEAMTFFTIVIGSLVRQSGRRPSGKLLRELSAKVHVYGDDIIVPAETAAGVMEDLEAYGLKVNHAKSFHTGSFRESCGGDYYQGHDVTPVYCRRWDDTGTARDSRVVSSYFSLSNQFYMKGLWNASQYVRDHLSAVFGRDFPRTTAPVGGLTFASVHFSTGLTWDRNRSGWRVKSLALRAGRRPDRLHDMRAIMLASFGARALSVARGDRRRNWNSGRPDLRGCEWTDGFQAPSPSNLEGSGRGSDSDALSVLLLSEGVSSAPQCGRDLRPFSHEWNEMHNLELAADILRIKASSKLDQDTSVDPYTSNTKYRWIAAPCAAIKF